MGPPTALVASVSRRPRVVIGQQGDQDVRHQHGPGQPIEHGRQAPGVGDQCSTASGDANVRFGSLADILRLPPECLLSGVKRT